MRRWRGSGIQTSESKSLNAGGLWHQLERVSFHGYQLHPGRLPLRPRHHPTRMKPPPKYWRTDFRTLVPETRGNWDPVNIPLDLDLDCFPRRIEELISIVPPHADAVATAAIIPSRYSQLRLLVKTASQSTGSRTSSFPFTHTFPWVLASNWYAHRVMRSDTSRSCGSRSWSNRRGNS